MRPLRIFISSVQKEFATERAALRDYLRGDALMRRFFEPFLFEEMPAADRRADAVYLDEVAICDIYVGLFGDEYGVEDAEGISPTVREFEHAGRLNKYRLIFVKGAADSGRHPKMRALIDQAGGELIRRRFVSVAELIGALYAALVQYLEVHELIRNGPFDASPCAKATLADLDEERMATFLRRARRARGFPLPEEATTGELLTHLNLLDAGRPTNAAVLLFGKQPQRFLISSEVKCAHFHGTEVAKPIPSYQVYKGTVFDLVDQAVDFVMSKINLWVGTREAGPQVPVRYEIPREVVTEAIVNAVAHRDYASNGSVQVMLTKYIERMGTGTGDMIRRCREAGLPEPEFTMSDGFVITLRRNAGEVTGQVTGQVDPWVIRVLEAFAGRELRSAEIQEVAGIRHRETFQRNYLDSLLNEGWLERTIPDKPKSRLQKYRLTSKGEALRVKLTSKKDA